MFDLNKILRKIYKLKISDILVEAGGIFFTNLLNNKSIIAKVGSKANYPEFYNSVISERIYNELEIDRVEPYVEIIALNKSSVFIANKAKTFDEEKKVANKAPVEGISIKNLNKHTNDKNIKKYQVKIKKYFCFFISIKKQFKNFI